MSEIITSNNLDEVVRRNSSIHRELEQNAQTIRANFNQMQLYSSPQLALQILASYGLIQMPIDSEYFSGAIFVKNGARIPVINTALPRVNQYFTAWHEIYHLLFDKVSFDLVIDADTIMEERKAEHFASLMLLGNLVPYYFALPEMDFVSKVFHCMSAFQAPYKAVLIGLYEGACQSGNCELRNLVLNWFDHQPSDIVEQFRKLGLDDTLVTPSNVINLNSLYSIIQEMQKQEPHLSYHEDNLNYLKKLLKELYRSVDQQYD
jgi:hypothetical protein